MSTTLTATAAPPSDPAPDPRVRQRDYLLSVARALNADLDLPQVLGRVIRAAVAMTGGQAGAIALRQPDGDLRVAASFQLEERFEHFLEPLLDPPGAPAQAAPTGVSSAALPRRAGGRGRAGPEAPAPGASAPTLPGIPAPGSALRETGGDGASTAAPARPAARHDRLRLPDPAAAAPLARAAAAPGTGLAVVDLGTGSEAGRQALALPLEIGEAVIGRIFVFRSEGAAAFTPLDGQLLQTFADQAAVAIHNADTHARLAARERRLSALVEFSPAGSLLVAPDGTIRAHNPTAALLAGHPGEDLVGRDIRTVLALADPQGHPVVVDLPAGDGGATTVHGHVRPAGGGAPGAWVQLTLTALPSPHGQGAGFVADVVDLTGYKEAEDAKRAFLAGLSHALKTPLSLIRGFAETLRHPHIRSDDALAGEAIDVILDETGHMTRMVDQLLEAARLESGALRLDRHVVDLATEVRRVVDAFRGAHPGRAWSLDVAAGLPPVYADPLRLHEVLQNLVANAVAYSPPGSPVEVRAAAADGGRRVQVEVRDHGSGIAPADQARVFDRFERAARGGGGAGLGLYMTRAIVEAHGGRVDLASDVGRGSTFTVTLPAWTPDAAPAATADVEAGRAPGATDGGPPPAGAPGAAETAA